MAPTHMMRRLLREPLLHFLLIGAVLFLIYGLLNRGAPDRSAAVVISATRVEAIAQNFAAVWMRPPTANELKGLVDDYIAEELYYREAVAMGLDQDDTIIRRRLRQKMEFISESVADAVEPSDAQLQAFLAGNAAKFAPSDQVSLQQVFLSPDRRGDALRADAAKVLLALQSVQAPADPASAGDATLLPPAVALASVPDLQAAFGESFAQQVAGLPVGQWSGPVESEFGLHLVRVDERIAGKAPSLDDIRPAVLREWQAGQRQRQNETALAALRDKYKVQVEGPAAKLFAAAADDGGAAQ